MESEVMEEGDLQPRFGVEGDMEVANGYPKFKIVESPLAADSYTPSSLRDTPPFQGESFLGRVYINEKQYFEGVHEDMWGFMIGGYQVVIRPHSGSGCCGV